MHPLPASITHSLLSIAQLVPFSFTRVCCFARGCQSVWRRLRVQMARNINGVHRLPSPQQWSDANQRQNHITNAINSNALPMQSSVHASSTSVFDVVCVFLSVWHHSLCFFCWVISITIPCGAFHGGLFYSKYVFSNCFLNHDYSYFLLCDSLLADYVRTIIQPNCGSGRAAWDGDTLFSFVLLGPRPGSNGINGMHYHFLFLLRMENSGVFVLGWVCFGCLLDLLSSNFVRLSNAPTTTLYML